MSTIVPPAPDKQADDWRLPADFWTITPTALGARLVYEGPFPERPRDYYALAGVSHRVGYVYILSGLWPIYIGRSWRPGNRFDRHRRRDWWSHVQNLTLLEVEADTRRVAEAITDRLETYAIQRLSPTHNVAKVLA